VTNRNILRTLTALTASALLAAGCGGSTSSDVTTSSPGGAPASTDAPQMSDQQAPPARLVIDVTIKGGQVTPTNAQLQAKVAQTIVVRVNSDAADQLHVHSNPEHTFNVEAKPAQSFQFTVTVPGKVDIELHQLNKTIATVTVQ
jgi:sporulation-control protein spo0M